MVTSPLGRMVARWYALVPEPVKRIIRIITLGYLCPLPLPPRSIFLSGLSVSSDTGRVSRWLATLRAYTLVVYASMTIDTRHTFTSACAIRPWPRNNCSILSIRSARRHRCVVTLPRCLKTGRGRRGGGRKKVTNRYPNLELTLT